MEARDEQALLALFAPDATWTADGGGKTAAAPRPIVGADRIARLVIGLREKFWARGSHARDRHRQRRDRPVHPRWRAPDRDDVDRHGWRAHSRRLRGREPGQALTRQTPVTTVTADPSPVFAVEQQRRLTHESTNRHHEVPDFRPGPRDVQRFRAKRRRASTGRCSSSSRSARRRSTAAPIASTCTRRTRALAGETEQRIYALNAWRETPFFTDRERAALEWTEAVTRVADTHVPDEVYERVAAQFDEAELVALTFAVIVINGWNRLAVSFRPPVGTYQPAAAAAV